MKSREDATNLIRSLGVFLGRTPSSITTCVLPALLLVACGAPEARRTLSTVELTYYTGHGDIDEVSRSRVGDVPFGSHGDGDIDSYGVAISVQPLAWITMRDEARVRHEQAADYANALHWWNKPEADDGADRRELVDALKHPEDVQPTQTASTPAAKSAPPSTSRVFIAVGVVLFSLLSLVGYRAFSRRTSLRAPTGS